MIGTKFSVCIYQAENETLQARALQALQGFAKGKRGGVSMPMQAMQEAFQTGGGLPRLITLLDRAATPKPGGATQRNAITSGAVDALAAMTRNNASARFPDIGHHPFCKLSNSASWSSL